MSEKPEWMPSRDVLVAMCHNESLYSDCDYGYAGEEAEDVVRSAGIRAQIAVLEEAADALDRVPLIVGMFQWFRNEIAALRKELGE